MIYQFTFAQNRPKSDISGALGPIHYITLKAFAIECGIPVQLVKEQVIKNLLDILSFLTFSNLVALVKRI